MKPKKVKTNSPVQWCKKHPNCFEWTCKSCHQSSLEYTEIRLMDLHEEIKGLLSHAKEDIKKGAHSSWGWTGGDFIVKWSEEDD